METLLTFVGIAVAVLAINLIGHVRAINSGRRMREMTRAHRRRLGMPEVLPSERDD